MEVRAFFALVVPFIVVVYMAFILVIRPTRTAWLSSLLAGLFMGLVNFGVDQLAYYAHWWHFNLNDLILHVPLPFYITPVLMYGSVVYMGIWRLWSGRAHWFALALLFGIPAFGIIRDLYSGLMGVGYATWDNPPVAALVSILMWLVMFYGGYFIFQKLTPPRQPEALQDAKSA